jgi:hypothetical protein
VYHENPARANLSEFITCNLSELLGRHVLLSNIGAESKEERETCELLECWADKLGLLSHASSFGPVIPIADCQGPLISLFAFELELSPSTFLSYHFHCSVPMDVLGYLMSFLILAWVSYALTSALARVRISRSRVHPVFGVRPLLLYSTCHPYE